LEDVLKAPVLYVPERALHESYHIDAPPSPTDIPFEFRGLTPDGSRAKPVQKQPGYQIEYGDLGFFLRRPKNYRSIITPNLERRFSYAVYETPDLTGACRASRNPYKMGKDSSTKKWAQKWDHQTIGLEAKMPAYSSLSDPYCAKYCRSLYSIGTKKKKKAFDHTAKAPIESDHDYYKRQEATKSNSFNRARRRSVELIEHMESNHQATTLTLTLTLNPNPNPNPNPNWRQRLRAPVEEVWIIFRHHQVLFQACKTAPHT